MAAAPTCELAESIAGSLRTLSARGLSFAHAQPFVSQIAVLTFELGQGQRLCVVVDVLGSEATVGGFLSRGTVLDVGVPGAQEVPGTQPGACQADAKQPAAEHDDLAEVEAEACTA